MKYSFFAILCVALSISISVNANDPIVYPSQNQTAEQQEKDKFECYSWAKEQTGFDPMATPKTQSPHPVKTTGPNRGRGVAGGAAIGGIVGATQGEFGKGAAVGAGAGAVGGGVRNRQVKRQNQQRQQAWAQQEAARYQQNRDGYNRAFSACLEGRGYTVR